MKTKHFLILVLSFLLSVPLQAQVMPVNPDSLNLAVLIVDYDSLVFEGGNLSYYEKCTCPDDSLPFVPIFNSPGDFGGITFTLQQTGDTIFDASIVWMGLGGIYYPSEFSLQWPFQYYDLAVPKPQLEYFDWTGQKTTDQVIMQKADSAWDRVDSLIITSFFADYDYKAGIYLYPPTVGTFDPLVAKWVVFLYYNELVYSTLGSENENSIQVFPNPFSDQLTVNFNPKSKEYQMVEIFDLNGQKLSVDVGISKQSASLDLSILSSGVYLLRSNHQGNALTTKIVKL